MTFVYTCSHNILPPLYPKRSRRLFFVSPLRHLNLPIRSPGMFNVRHYEHSSHSSGFRFGYGFTITRPGYGSFYLSWKSLVCAYLHLLPSALVRLRLSPFVHLFLLFTRACFTNHEVFSTPLFLPAFPSPYYPYPDGIIIGAAPLPISLQARIPMLTRLLSPTFWKESCEL